ncbi:MAG: Flp pilus assembly complex ATPase component TadA [Clostridiales bacterium]|jgi:pilus assembly protein CpaF|nr:Flp pilus assembly complex ATPase component TadA [Clostridiales bacterium]
MRIFDLVLSILLITCVAVTVYYIFKARVDYDITATKYSLEVLCDRFKNIISDIINMDMDLLNLNKRDLNNRRALKRSLSNAIRRCSQGDMNSKIIVLSRVKHTLLNVININEENINDVIAFNDIERLNATDKFEIMMYLQKQSGNSNMFQGICETTGLDRLCKGEEGYYYCISDEDIHMAYNKIHNLLSFDDKLNILSQRVYEDTYGLSVVDLLIMEDTSLDSISGGVSGITSNNCSYIEDDIISGSHKPSRTYDSIWVVYKGKPIHLKFLSFGSDKEIRRICKNLAEHGRTGHLTSSEGGIKTHLADGSRVTVFRPNNSSQWTFFVRKYANTAYFELKDLITDHDSHYPIETIRWAIHGCVNLFFTGDQNSGKTTYTRAAVKEIDKRQPIRTLEADFELYLNDAYADKNILGTRPSARLPFPKLIELLKSSEAHTVLFGETASLEHAKHLIDLLLAGTKRIISTGHWATTDDLISYFVHALSGYGNSDVEIIQSMVARLIRLDIHCVKDNDGHRYIDRITEIIPYDSEERSPNGDQGVIGRLGEISHYLKLLTRKKAYYTRDIVIYEEGRYRMINGFSDGLAEIILNNLPPDKRQSFLDFNERNNARFNDVKVI